MSTDHAATHFAPPKVATISPWLMSPWWPADSLGTKQRSLLRILSVATSENIVPAPLVFCLAHEHRGSYSRKLKRLAQRLASGMTLPDAIENTPGVLPDDHMLAVRFGTQSGILSQVFESILSRDQSTGHSLRARLIELALYSKFMLATMFFILLFMMVKIVPSFQAIFDDFELDLPRITLWLIESSEFFINYWYLFALVLIGIFVLGGSHASRSFFSRTLFSRVIPPVASLRSAEMMDLLSVSVAAGRPVAGALSTMARYHTYPVIRRKLLFVFNEVEQGADPWESMVATRLINAKESAAIVSATSQESRAWTMNRLAQLRRERFTTKVDAFGNLLQTAATLCLGAIVLFVGVALLLPLFDLVNNLN